MLRLVALTLSFFLLCLSQLTSESKSKTRLWQEGELVSKKTIAVGHTRYQYVYRVRGSDLRYLIVLNEPLKLNLYVPIKFSVGRRNIFIQDLDGIQRKTVILEQRGNTLLPLKLRNR
jgi:hypothetical protein